MISSPVTPSSGGADVVAVEVDVLEVDVLEVDVLEVAILEVAVFEVAVFEVAVFEVAVFEPHPTSATPSDTAINLVAPRRAVPDIDDTLLSRRSH